MAVWTYNESVTFPRSSGILLHPTSLPGRFGIGDLGPEAFRFVDFLAAAGQRIWQVLPLGPTGYGDSPYQLFSAFAGNPLLISPEQLAEEGLLTRAELAHTPEFPPDQTDFACVIPFKFGLLRTAFERFKTTWKNREFDSWLPDFALFMALKMAHGGEAIWSRWEPDIAARKPAAMDWREGLADEIAFVEFTQYMFHRQWRSLHDYAHERGIRIMGDLPIYVAHDSADVWANPDLFQLDAAGRSAGDVRRAAGLFQRHRPAVGQSDLPLGSHGAERLSLVDRPHARRASMRGHGAAGSLPRLRSVLGSSGRRDHGAQRTLGEGSRRGAVRGAARSARRAAHRGGKPGRDHAGSGSHPHQFGFPGMAILQFAFGKDPQAPDFKPHNYPRDVVAYTGTHDNDTTVGWWTSTGAGDSTRTAADIQRRARLHARNIWPPTAREIHWVFIRALMASVADTVLFPCRTCWVWAARRA